VLDLVVRGQGNKAIATELGISEQATKEHVSTLLRRFGVTSRAALAEIGTQLQILGSTDVDTSWLPYLFVAAPIGIQVLRGPEHRVVAVNATNRRVLDREVVGLTFAEAFPLSADRMLPLLDRVYTTGEPHREYEFAGIWLRDGVNQTSYGDFVIQPIREPDGTVSGVMIFGADVTDRVLTQRRAEQLNAEQLAIFDLVNEGVVVSDATGRLLKVNEAGHRLTGLSNDGDEQLNEERRPFNLRDADGRSVPFADVPLVRALRGETVPWADYVLFNPVRRADVKVRLSARPIRANNGTVIGGVVVYRPVRAE
jgi:PAS domain-containing protein